MVVVRVVMVVEMMVAGCDGSDIVGRLETANAVFVRCVRMHAKYECMQSTNACIKDQNTVHMLPTHVPTLWWSLVKECCRTHRQ